MALGALIAAYQEDDSGGHRALYPLAGQTLVEYQARCAAAVGASPIVILTDAAPPALDEAIQRMRGEGLMAVAVDDANEAASRFEAGALILLIADGLAPDVGLCARLSDVAATAVALVPDDEEHQAFERVDAAHRWAGVAIVDQHSLGSTAAMLGDWDLQSTLLRRVIQDGARRVLAGDAGGGALLATRPEDLAGFERRLLSSSRGARTDWASRFLLPLVEEFATERLMETRVGPAWLLVFGLVLLAASALCFSRGWLWPGLGLALLSTPFDLVAGRLATLRMKPLSPAAAGPRLFWPLSGLVLIALGWWLSRHGAGWGAMVSAVAAAGFAQATRVEQGSQGTPADLWLFSRRNAMFAVVPFAIPGWWSGALVALLVYAAASLFVAQHFRHHNIRD